MFQLLNDLAAHWRSMFSEANPGEFRIVPEKCPDNMDGELTVNAFRYARLFKTAPDKLAELSEEFLSGHADVEKVSRVKAFVNVTLNPAALFRDTLADVAGLLGEAELDVEKRKRILIEYSAPNTNKPLHLGHIRNNLLGYSVARILEANGNRVIKANLVNDRGIHICKSMLAWLKFGGGETPASSGKKGDHLVGDYYVAFDKAYKAEIKKLVAEGMDEEQAKHEAPIMKEAQEMLRKWEAKDPEVYKLWQTMNGWVYEGFDTTYRAMGVSFDKIYYESNTYLLGKSLVDEGLSKGVFFRKEDGSVWCDLTGDGLDQKLLLRGDGTSVYMTQDLGTAYTRFKEEHLDEMIYVVGNEQNYHFQVLKLILKKLGYGWADAITHLSYGMVELPEGKMKSREGTVVDADDLIDEMVRTAHDMSQELGKLDDATPEEAASISHMVGLGALKYFILKVDPRKTMLFDPRESIDFNGNTGPFIQYTHARIRSVLRKAAEKGIEPGKQLPATELSADEVRLIKLLTDYPTIVAQAAENFSPALIANYVYELSKEYNSYYHDYPILRETDAAKQTMRLTLSGSVARIIAEGMSLLGIGVPQRM